MEVLLIVGGLVLLFFGGEAILRGSVAIAQKLKLSTLLVSMVIVGFGTSLPELLVSVTAALEGVPNIALGNVVGSNIANILLILGVAAVLAPVACGRLEMRRDMLVVVLAGIVLVALAQNGSIGRPAGIAMVVSLVAYLSYAFFVDRSREKAGAALLLRVGQDIVAPVDVSFRLAVIFVLAGLLFLAGGAYALVEGATSLAKQMGVSNAIIGLTLVAVGTSLPELATVIVAAYRRQADVVIGNIMGSNLFNSLGILGVTTIISPMPIEGRIADIDVWVMLAVAVGLAPLIWRGTTIGRREGAILVTLYVLYTAWVYSVDF